jgi:RNA polymerase sigma-70 factor (ECF subfamily)
MPAGADGGSTVPVEAPARARAEQVARASYGRLVAILAASNGDIQLAEDCLSDAFAQALQRWPQAGTPENPEAWLLTAARNRQRDVYRSAAHRTSAPLDEAIHSPACAIDELDPDTIPDRRLALLFVCAHPAIDPAVRSPLMLQTVLGLQVRQIARIFAIPEATLAQRLVRAKRRIRETRIPFALPDPAHLPGRLEAVLEAVYGAYAIDWLVVSGPTVRESLAAEARYLAVMLAELLPDEPEALGLAALLSLSLARVGARGAADAFLPLEEQNPAQWDAGLIREGEDLLRRASVFRRIGRFQLEAAIQSVHCARASSGLTNWAALRSLYAALVAIVPTLGARVAFAAATGRAKGPRDGLAALDLIPDEALRRFQPAWATRAHLLAEAGHFEDALEAYDRAIVLTTERSVREYLARKRAEVAEEAAQAS